MKQGKTIIKVKTKKGGRVDTEGEDFEKVDHVTNGMISTQNIQIFINKFLRQFCMSNSQDAAGIYMAMDRAHTKKNG